MNRQIAKKALLLLTFLISLPAWGNSGSASCSLDLSQATSAIHTYLEDNDDTMADLMGVEALDDLKLRVDSDTFFMKDHEYFFLQVANLSSDKIKGHVWLEVDCEGHVLLDHYIEERYN